MLKTIAVAVVLLLVGVLAFAATRPDTFRVKRAISVKAPPEAIFALINDFHLWASWSPYERKDPALKRTYSGAAKGKGAVYGWEGNKRRSRERICPPPCTAITQPPWRNHELR